MGRQKDNVKVKCELCSRAESKSKRRRRRRKNKSIAKECMFQDSFEIARIKVAKNAVVQVDELGKSFNDIFELLIHHAVALNLDD